MFVPWSRWLRRPAGQALLDLWCAGILAFVIGLVAAGDTSASVLLFLAVPFVAVAQAGSRRAVFLAAAACSCLGTTLALHLPVGPALTRLLLVGACVAIVLVIGEALRRARWTAEIQRARVVEADHRVKNGLQAAADLLLLGRPGNGDGRAFDEAATRIRSLATVHRLLAEGGDERVHVDRLLMGVAREAQIECVVEAEPLVLDARTAHRLALVANELIANAGEHGTPPVRIRLEAGNTTRLLVDDAGRTCTGAEGLGLTLVRRLVEHGLGGTFRLAANPGGGTRAEVLFRCAS
jgi:two-component sensor histidine kinase